MNIVSRLQVGGTASAPTAGANDPNTFRAHIRATLRRDVDQREMMRDYGAAMDVYLRLGKDAAGPCPCGVLNVSSPILRYYVRVPLTAAMPLEIRRGAWSSSPEVNCTLMAKPRSTKATIVDYAAPPINEVVFGVRYVPLKDWKLPHVGAFWCMIADEFTKVEHAPPIPDAGTEIVDEASGTLLPRIWLINQTDDRLVQLQAGRFYFNWRQRKDDHVYPHYAELWPVFQRIYNAFSYYVSSLGAGSLELREFELTYINHLLSDKWPLREMMHRMYKVPSWNAEMKFLPRPASVAWEATFPWPERGSRLTVKSNPAFRGFDGKRIMSLELTARGLPEDSPDAKMADWFASAHEWIVRGFEDLTTEEAQTELWGRYE